MFATSQDVLFMSLALGFIVLVIFLSIALMYLIFILRDTSMMTHDAKEVTHKVNQVVISPLRFLGSLTDHLKPFIDSIKQRKGKHDEEDEE